jgi:ABC-type antimicrobial peptide transport system permease subunit
VLAGVLIGLPAAMILTRALRSLLFGVGAYDLITLAGAVGTVLVVAGIASYLPARRATRVDPMNALRSE